MVSSRKADEEKPGAEERAEIEETWIQESLRRMMEIETGQTEPIPAKEVHDYIRARIKSARRGAPYVT